ncbi:cytosine permease [Domibacillus sp. A3M-37]|uniref:cytosine permease n=1 Tax=Domibacillus sp. A3M-37 TaxID=2962037 RepID=UPI0020B6D8A4|nr:cytosine permease [Domibacillus sp. A3M-37]MCP3761348.1 cytosine permease [Domibacillus sp. A3M-37]
MKKEKELSLIGKDIIPTKEQERTISTFGFFLLWIGIAVQLVTFVTAAQLYPALSPTQIVVAALLGNLVVAALLTLLGDFGIKYGIPYAVFIRACFGYLGTHIPATVRAVPAIFWFGFQTWMGAAALNEIMKVLFGYSNLTLLIILFGAVQIINTAMGMEAIKLFEMLAAPSILVIGIYLQYLIMNRFDTSLSSLFAQEGNGSVSLGYGVVVFMGLYITMALNASDFTRFLKVNKQDRMGSWLKTNKGSAIAHTLGLVSSTILFTIIGMTSGVATGNWDPIAVMTEVLGEGNPFILVVCLAFVIIAQWSTNISANLLPPAYIMVNYFPKKISFTHGAIIAGIIGLVIQPWQFADFLPQILIAISALLAPIAGIMFCDYYLLRKRQLNLEELYRSGGQYKYWNNINPAAIIAYIPAGITVYMFPDYGFITAFIVSNVLYYPLMKFWIGKKYYQPEIYGKIELKHQLDEKVKINEEAM